MVIAVPKEILPGENRVACTPDVASKLIKAGFQIQIEKDAGLNAGFTNTLYEKSGAKIVDLNDLYSSADIVLKVQRPLDHPSAGKNEIDLMKDGTLLITFLYPLNHPELAKKCAANKINVISMDMIPRTTLAQKMDALSSQANIAGYKSVIMTADHLGKIFPMLMTAAGTISPAKVVIMGAGVAGLQALGTAKRLGAVVEVSDIRAAVKEEVHSLGGKFIEVEGAADMQDAGGYAKEVSQEFLKKQKDLIFKHITEADIVITTALVPGKKAPVLVTEEMVKNMRPGSVVLDMAVEFGGNCEVSEKGKIVKKYGVTIIGEPNLPSLVPTHSSEMYSKNILAFIQHFGKEGKVELRLEDEIIKGALITLNGEVVNQRIKDLLK
ncbi:MAG: Re/Si-specific NAD(P)(+) transhydrogenase subunit alpha [Ignavibacteriota bacterium]|jgi:NAD(P) transhydrogenase subunit alpha|nr:MAG: Re/Si-specific NAD(P)(+) transhydrogenase subunit alpha [Chlorobiota bacterium]MBE7477431.1 Re/Si-specific NAD(P)(+) transhydrogenase subunit alpha [Ignavibacteriales bacterium]MBL1122833.1 Re/Si-specific NAD(P)(+) transhydrogenase subunit alpha [Ignavibacteriota bacterium]MCC7093222.1 Re/Si-specific NAD(P)(+) transhydrogenase subunit alpha [Ignavibacteriaceae bacterium]MCE7857374.1 Re/Si-specific NAD(P)(+) transhydrogenase subunit alpha [Ignavibacteria bacterium CHB3]MEB2296884.1 Re/S